MVRRAIVLIVAVLGLAIMPAPAAHAGDYVFTMSSCRNDVSWEGVPGYGTWYFTAWDWTYHWMDGNWFQVYRANGAECGKLGAPLGYYSGVDVVYYDGTNEHRGIQDGHPCGRFACAGIVVTDHIHFEHGCIFVGLSSFQATTDCRQ